MFRDECFKIPCAEVVFDKIERIWLSDTIARTIAQADISITGTTSATTTTSNADTTTENTTTDTTTDPDGTQDTSTTDTVTDADTDTSVVTITTATTTTDNIVTNTSTDVCQGYAYVISTCSKCFDSFRRGECNDFRRYLALFAFCAPCENDPVYVKTGDSDDLIPLRSARGGFAIKGKQIKHLCNACKVIGLSNCYDKCNDHINILNDLVIH